MKKMLVLVFALLLFSACNNKAPESQQKYGLTAELSYFAPYDEGYPIADDTYDEKAPYETTDYKEYYSDYYKDKVAPPPFDFSADLSHKTFEELRLLRAEIMARHGFLFMDYVLRSHFNATKWYQPVFWYNEFKIKLSAQEKEFMDKVLKVELAAYKAMYYQEEGRTKANNAIVANWKQFEKLPASFLNALAKDGFVINTAEHTQLFHVYDQNYYDYTPSFITTDVYLQVLHMHLSKEMQAIEQRHFVGLLKKLLSDQYNQHKQLATGNQNPAVKAAAEWNQTYYAMALSLLTEEIQAVPSRYKQVFEKELEKATEAQERKSDFTGDSLFDFTQFTARGNYTRNDTLKRYFKCVKWLNSAPIYIDDNDRLRAAIIAAKMLKQNTSSYNDYLLFSDVTGFLAGEENNLSFIHLYKVLDRFSKLDLNAWVSDEHLTDIREQLYALDPKKFSAKGDDDNTQSFIHRKKVLFTAARYTFDAEILQRLVYITRPERASEPLRPFPKSLDVFAAMGNKTAESILLNDYKENEKWSGYGDTLNVLKKKFSGLNDWNKNVYSKTMECVLSLQKRKADDPHFMQSEAWQKKDLNTMLAAWTELKHDMVLYVDQPSGAEMGDGGEVPPPQKIAYVEPRVEFWNKCVELLELNQQLFSKYNLVDEAIANRTKKLIKMGNLFSRYSTKELKHQKLSSGEFDTLSFIGGQIESLTLDIIEAQESFLDQVSTPEKCIAIATDVYTYNHDCLQETVGLANDIYVIAEINGLLYLTRGAVFSNYEFIHPSSARLTDEEWQSRLEKKQVPARHPWMKQIQQDHPTPKTEANFNLY